MKEKTFKGNNTMTAAELLDKIAFNEDIFHPGIWDFSFDDEYAGSVKITNSETDESFIIIVAKMNEG